MITDRSEEEQVEVLKKWLKENGVSMVLGITLALAGVFGYRAWDNSVRQAGEAASAIYENLVAAVMTVPDDGLSEKMLVTGRTLADQLKNEHGDSSYASFAAMTMAKVSVDAGDLDKAAAELKWVLANGAKGSIEILARIRLARVLSALESYEEALTILEARQDLAAHHATWQEVKGDVYLSMGRNDEARQAYQLAVNSVKQQGSRPYLEMKLADMTFAPAQGEIEDAVEQAEEGAAAEEGTAADKAEAAVAALVPSKEEE